ncbi:hypothetical protein AGMMS50230_15480 [Spirochaetia bacterium]|nr:hypothetical protein AGMMS50230_15480 [Spirochaetia bacterium]
MLFVLVPALFGQERQEDVLSQADALIDQKRYTQAMNLLVPYMQNNPDNFDQAQRRIRRITQARNEYNKIVGDLVLEMEKPEPNNRLVLEMTNRLRDLDPERIAETQDIIKRIQEMALFKENQRELERIMNQGQELVDQGQYAEALRVYARGLTIYQDEFFRSGFGAAMENRVRQGINDLLSNVNAVNNSATALRNAVDDLENLSNQEASPQNLNAYRTAYNRLGAEMDRFTGLRDIYTGTDMAFREELATLRQNNPQGGDRNFLAFAVRLLEGHPGDTKSGMLGSFDVAWNREIPRARNLLDTKSRSVYIAAANDASRREYNAAGRRAELMGAYAEFPLDLELRWNRYDKGTGKPILFNQIVAAGEEANYLKFRALSATSPYWTTLSQLGIRFNAVQSRDTLALWREGGDAGELMQMEQAFTVTLRQLREEAQTLSETIQQETAGFQDMESQYPASGAEEYINGISAAARTLIGSITQQEGNSAVNRYTIANSQMESRVAAREAEFRQGAELLQGAQKENYLARYPTRAGVIFSRLEASLTADQQNLEALLGQYAQEPPEIAGNSRVSSLRSETQAMQSRLEAASLQRQGLAASAASLAQDAQRLRQDGDRYYAEAEAALARDDFTVARNRVGQAADAYFQSTEREDDEETWNKNAQVRLLDERITSRLNEDVLIRVAALLNQIRDAYYGSEFDRAEGLITQAQNIWKLTQPNPHSELVTWAAMIEAGARSSRSIPATAPLYTEMSQLLSEARKNYEEGRRFMTSSEVEGKRWLTTAQKNVEKVKLVYPLNEEAGVLALQIEREIDQSAFAASFEEKYRSAIRRNETGSGTVRIEALNDLRNLRAINPQYTNWAPLIRQAEINAGLRRPDPTAQDIAEARAIVNRVRPLVNAKDMSQMSTARTDLERAMNLDSNNQEAKNLYTEVARVVYRGNLTLDIEAERLYQQALTAVQQGNGVRALALINQIYARNPDYRYVQKMVVLEQRARSL